MKVTVDVKNAQATEKTRGSDMVAEGMMDKAGLMRVDWCDEKRADKINESILRFLTGCALPFTIVESHSCKHSRPLYDT